MELQAFFISYALLIKLDNSSSQVSLAGAIPGDPLGCAEVFEQTLEERQLVRFESARQR